MRELDRRSFLTRAVTALGLSATASWQEVAALTQAPAAGRSRRIDIHHHFAPPAWIAEVRGRPLLQPANTAWTPEQSIEDLDRAGSAAAVISITNPGLWFGDRQATNRVARACNEYGAKLVQQYPTRFGLFAAMPLPDVDATLKEIAYAYDVLKVDGIGLFTSYGDAWLGNAAFTPVMAELNRRKAVVHVHPTAANCCRNLAYGTAPGSIEYGTDTTRAIIGVTFNGDTTRYPDIRFIWSHAGGSAPFFAGRIDGALAQREGQDAGRLHRRGEEVLLRHRRCGQPGRYRIAAGAGLFVADPVRDRFSSRRHQPGHCAGGGRARLLQGRRAARDRTRECRAAAAAAQGIDVVRSM